jgi:hypothetical protein
LLGAKAAKALPGVFEALAGVFEGIAPAEALV